MANQYGIEMGNVLAAKMNREAQDNRNYLTERQRKADGETDIIRAAAQDAVDPATGQYDPQKHLANLERAGYPEVAEKYRTEQQQKLGRTFEYFERVLPFANEGSWPKIREELVQQGMPSEFIPEQFDPTWLQGAMERTGQAIERFGPVEEAYNANGQVLVGQKNLGTGEFANLRDMSPPAPRAAGGAAGAGRVVLPPAAVRSIEFLKSQGVSEQEAIDRVLPMYQRPPNPGAEYGRNFRATYDPLIGDEGEAAATAGRVTDEVDRRARGASGAWSGRPAPAAAPGATPPVSALKEGVATKFKNGQVWTLKGGQPVRVQ